MHFSYEALFFMLPHCNIKVKFPNEVRKFSERKFVRLPNNIGWLRRGRGMTAVPTVVLTFQLAFFFFLLAPLPLAGRWSLYT